MPTKSNGVWSSSDNSTRISDLANTAGAIVVLDEATLGDVSGGSLHVGDGDGHGNGDHYWPCGVVPEPHYQ